MPTMTEPTPTAEPVAPPVAESESTPEAIESAESIADHAEQFGPQKATAEGDEPRRPAANTGQFAHKTAESRHKAQSQRATPEDVAEINRLTKELRETERRLGEKDPDATSSPRIRALKRQIAALKALEAPEPKAAEAPKASESPKPAPKAEVKPSSGTFSEKEPAYEDFQQEPDPYAAWIKATARYEARKERWEAAQAEQAARQQAEEQGQIQAYQQGVAAFAAKTPDFSTVTAELVERTLPPVLLKALVTADSPGDFVYYLAQHPDLADDLVLLTDGKPVTDALVATVQRRIRTALGQAAHQPDRPPAAPPFLPPKPPNPVRTAGPMKTADEPPGEAGSIADHARYYGKKR